MAVARGADNIDTLDFDAVEVRYIRMNIHTMASDKNTYPSIWEVELYDTNEPKGGSTVNKQDPEGVPTPSYDNLKFDAATGYVTGFKAGETANDYEGLTIKKGAQTVSGTSLICTGNTVVYNNKTYKIVVIGDVNGDGKVNSTDFMQVRRHYLGLYTLTDANLKAADVNKDGKINSTDFMQIRRHFLGLFNVYA